MLNDRRDTWIVDAFTKTLQHRQKQRYAWRQRAKQRERERKKHITNQNAVSWKQRQIYFKQEEEEQQHGYSDWYPARVPSVADNGASECHHCEQ